MMFKCTLFYKGYIYKALYVTEINRQIVVNYLLDSNDRSQNTELEIGNFDFPDCLSRFGVIWLSYF